CTSFGCHGCTRPLLAKYFTQPTYGRKRSGWAPARILPRASDSLSITLNCGLLFGCALTYDANIAWPPSLPYPAQSITCRRPDSASAPSLSSAAAARSVLVPSSAPPPAATASFSSFSRLICPPTSVSALTLAPFSGRTPGVVEPTFPYGVNTEV